MSQARKMSSWYARVKKTRLTDQSSPATPCQNAYCAAFTHAARSRGPHPSAWVGVGVTNHDAAAARTSRMDSLLRSPQDLCRCWHRAEGCCFDHRLVMEAAPVWGMPLVQGVQSS